MGYGKAFESMYTGSMHGQSMEVFAVWHYAITHMRVTKLEAHVELNPKAIAPIFNTTPEVVAAAIAKLEEADPDSRSKSHEGRRLVAVTEKTSGPVQYLVVNGFKYRYTVDEQTKREKDRVRQRVARARKKVEAAGGEWDAFVSSGEWDGEGGDKVLATQKPMKKEGL